MTDTKRSLGSQLQNKVCPVERRGQKVYFNGVVVYEYKGDEVHFHPKYFDPFYASILDEKVRPLLFISDYYERQDLRYVQKGNLKMRSEGGMGVRTTTFNNFYDNLPWYDLSYELDGKEVEPELVRVSNGETEENKRLVNLPLFVESKIHTERKVIAIPENDNFFLNFSLAPLREHISYLNFTIRPRVTPLLLESSTDLSSYGPLPIAAFIFLSNVLLTAI